MLGLRISQSSKWKIGVKLVLSVFAIWVLFYSTTSLPNTLSGTVIELALWIIIVDLILEVLRAGIVSSYRKRNGIPKESVDNFVLGINTTSTILLFISGLGLLFMLSDADFRTLVTTLGLFSVAFAWIFKEYLSNIFDGIIIMFSRDFRVRDYIRFDDTKGRIRTIKFLNTEVYTDEGDTIYVPNSTLLSKNVINYSKASDKKIVTAFTLSKSLVNVVALEKKLTQLVNKQFKDFLTDAKPTLQISEVGKDSVSLSFEVPTKTYSFELEERVKKEIFSFVLTYKK